METRREFFKNAAILTGAAGLSGSLFESIKRAMAIEPELNSTFLDAEHVVILMQENRSFDHAFGSLRGVRGFNDPRAVELPDGNPVWVQTNDAGERHVPFRLDIKKSNATWMGSLPHGWQDQVDARNGGRYDRWLHVKRSGDNAYAKMPLTLGYYTREDIPFYYELADAFTICDQHFCSSLTGTTPNRLYLWSGTIRPEQDAKSPACVLNTQADYDNEVSWTTFPERLEDLGVSWKIYQNEVSVGVGLSDRADSWLANFGDNPLEYFTQFQVRFGASHRGFLQAQVKVRGEELDELRRAAGSAEADDKLKSQIVQAEARLRHATDAASRWSDEHFNRLSPREKSLIEKAFTTNSGDPDYHLLEEISYRDGDREEKFLAPKGDLFHQLRRDVADGKLPTVSWVVAPQQFSDHPSTAWFGAWYIAELFDILTKNPEVWKKTIFILTYDENDGYFDHVPPFVCPDPKQPNSGKVSSGIDASVEIVNGSGRNSPIGLGYRVPMVIASPWSRGGWVCSQVFDHTSPLQFLEKFITHKLGREVRETNISQWRRAVSGDLSSAFRPATELVDDRLKTPPRDEFIAQIYKARMQPPPTGYHALTDEEVRQVQADLRQFRQFARQEPGTKPSCSLPYELVADGNLSEDRKRFTIRLEAGKSLFGDRSVGAPFTVYAYGLGGNVEVRNYAVSPGDKLEDAWSVADFKEGRYDIAIHGPNGFYRRFQGAASDPPVAFRMLPVVASANGKALSADVQLEIINRDSQPHAITLTDRAYGKEVHTIELPPGETGAATFPAERTHGWYDLVMKVAGDNELRKAYAGRLETGIASVTDPAMA